MLFDSKTATKAMKGLLHNAIKSIRENPTLAAWAIAAAGGAALVALPGAAALFLNSAGFAGTGVQSGSLAAAVHSTIDNVAVNSLFSILQSAGAGGVAAIGTINGAIQAAGEVMFGSGVGMAYTRYKVQTNTARRVST